MRLVGAPLTDRGPEVLASANFGPRIEAHVDPANRLQQRPLFPNPRTGDALVAFEREQDTRAQLEEAVRADQRAAELARNLHAQGLIAFLTVLVAEETLFTAQDSLAQSERDVALELIALYKALGGGWQVAGPTP